MPTLKFNERELDNLWSSLSSQSTQRPAKIKKILLHAWCRPLVFTHGDQIFCNESDDSQGLTCVPELSGNNICSFDLSTDHALTLNESGEVHAWPPQLLQKIGSESLAISNQVLYSTSAGPSPQKVQFPEPNVKIKMLACGGEKSYALSEDGLVYGWDQATFMAGDPFSRQPRCLAAKVKLSHLTSRPIVEIYAGQNTAFALDASGKLFGWGQNTGKQRFD